MKLARRSWFDEEEVTKEIYLLGSLIRGPVITVLRSAPVADVAKLLVETPVPAIAVIDDTHTLIGLVTARDVLRAEPAAVAGDAMSSLVFAIPASSTIESAAALMAVEGVGQVCVTAEDGELVGLVSAVDIARHVAMRAGYLP